MITPLPMKNNKSVLIWMSIVTTVAVLLGVVGYMYYDTKTNNSNKALGSFETPEEAFLETQRALTVLSQHVNLGIESVKYVQEYEDSKHLIFK